MKNMMLWAQDMAVSLSMGAVILTAATVLAGVGMLMTAAFVLSGGHLRTAQQV